MTNCIEWGLWWGLGFLWRKCSRLICPTPIQRNLRVTEKSGPLRFRYRLGSFCKDSVYTSQRTQFSSIRRGTGTDFLPSTYLFPLTVSFHQCSILIFISMLPLPEGQIGDAKELYRRQRTFENGEHWLDKYTQTCIKRNLCVTAIFI
jgi:hypothetical protein